MEKTIWRIDDEEAVFEPDLTVSEKLLDDISSWITEDGFKDFCAYMKKRVIGQPNLDLVCANIFAYLKAALRGIHVNQNTMIAAPSGSGKTETYRAVRDYFRERIPMLPVFMVDTMQLTPSGFKGSNLEEVFTPLFENWREDPEPLAIVFLDEFDKRLISTDSDTMESFNKTIRHTLLSILEGAPIYDKTSRVPKRVDTTNVLFFGMGSFEDFREKRKNEVQPVGFGAKTVSKDERYLADIDEQMLFDAGVGPELIGRFIHYINYGKLSVEAINAIIDKVVGELSLYYDCEIVLSDDYKARLRKRAASKIGCRVFNNMISREILKVMPKALAEKDLDVLTVKLADKTSYKWREYNESEKKTIQSIRDFLTQTIEDEINAEPEDVPMNE